MTTATFPLVLRQRRQWVLWDGKKIPLQPNGKEASSADPKTWSTFQDCQDALDHNPRFKGVGFVFSQSDPFVGIDFDDCFPVSPALQSWLDRFASFTEISQSGKGLHVIIAAEKPFSRCQFAGETAAKFGAKQIEIYKSGRYFALTGNLYHSDLASIEERQDVLNAFYCELSPIQETPRRERRGPVTYETTDAFIQDVITVLQKKGQGLFSTYEDFLRLGFALKSQQIPFAVFDGIVCHSDNYNPALNALIYERLEPKTITFGTAYHYAEQADPAYLQEIFTRRTPQKAAASLQDLQASTQDLITPPAPPLPVQDDAGNLTFTLQPGQFVKDLPLDFPPGFSLLESPTGSGKTVAIQRIAEQHPEKYIVACFPNQFLLLQAAGKHHINAVMEDKEFDFDARINYATYDSFQEKYPCNLLEKTMLVLDEYHTMISSSDKRYKGQVNSQVYRMMQKCPVVVGMTGTKIDLCKALEPPHTIKVLQPHKPQPHFEVITFDDSYKCLEDCLTPGKVNFIEINNKDGIAEIAAFFTGKGIPLIDTIFRDETKQEESPLFTYIKDNETLPPNFHAGKTAVVLTTCLFEMGINVNGVSVGSIIFFPHKRLNTKHQTQTVNAPHEVKQYISRFRDTTPDHIYIMRPAYQRNDPDAFFDGDAEYSLQMDCARADCKLLNHQIAAHKFSWLNLQVRNDMFEERGARCQYSKETNQFEPNITGIAYLLYRSQLDAFTANLRLYVQALIEEGLLYDGIKPHTALLTGEEQDLLEKARATASEQHQNDLKTELDALYPLSEKALERLQKPSAIAYQFVKLARYFGNPIAEAILYDTKGDGYAFAEIQRRVHINKYFANEKNVPAITAFYSEGRFELNKRYTSAQLQRIVGGILRLDPFLAKELTGHIRCPRAGITTNKTIRILRSFFTVEETRSNGKRFYILTSKTPLHDYIKKVTWLVRGHTLGEEGIDLRTIYENLRYNLITKKEPEFFNTQNPTSPDIQPLSSDTSENSIFKQSLESVTLESEYARDQIRIFGKVF